jgi:hypothetical protein
MAMMRVADPKAALTRSAAWALMCLVLLFTTWNRITSLRVAGQHVGAWRYAVAGGFIILLLMWISAGWKNWKRYHAGNDKQVS